MTGIPGARRLFQKRGPRISNLSKVIAGLTDEVEQRLLKGGNAIVENNESAGIRFDPNVLKYVLDELVIENKIKIFLHTFYNALTINNNRIEKIIVGNKDGIGTISADFFIDATGDGDLCRDAELKSFTSNSIQPPPLPPFFTEMLKRAWLN